MIRRTNGTGGNVKAGDQADQRLALMHQVVVIPPDEFRRRMDAVAAAARNEAAVSALAGLTAGPRGGSKQEADGRAYQSRGKDENGMGASRKIMLHATNANPTSKTSAAQGDSLHVFLPLTCFFSQQWHPRCRHA